MPVTTIPIAQLFNAAGTAASAALTTQTAMTFPVDYNDPSAATIPGGLVFVRQSDITDFLTAQAATTFKYVQNCWNALPEILRHNITFNLAAGQHHPMVGPESSLLQLSNRTLRESAIVSVLGATASTWTALDPSLQSLTIDSFDVGTAGDPWLDCSSSHPGIFTGFDLRGAYAVLDTGQVVQICKHTNDRLMILEALSPTPATITKIALPATELVDPTGLKTMMVSTNLDGAFSWISVLSDLRLTHAHANTWLSYSHGGTDLWIMLLRVYMDNSNGTTEGITVQSVTGGVLVRSCGFIGSLSPSYSAPFSTNFWGTPWCVFNWSYIRGYGRGVSIGCGLGGLFGTFLDTVASGYGGTPSNASIIMENCVHDFFDSQFGRNMTIRNAPLAGIYLGSKLNHEGWGIVGSPGVMCCVFEDCVGPCVRLGRNALLDLGRYGARNFIDGGGNLSVGFEFVGENATVYLDTVTSVTGALGPVRMGDGSIWQYPDITGLGPIVDGRGNIIQTKSHA